MPNLGINKLRLANRAEMFDSDTLPPTWSPRAPENKEMMPDESTQAEAVPSQ